MSHDINVAPLSAGAFAQLEADYLAAGKAMTTAMIAHFRDPRDREVNRIYHDASRHVNKLNGWYWAAALAKSDRGLPRGYDHIEQALCEARVAYDEITS